MDELSNLENLELLCQQVIRQRQQQEQQQAANGLFFLYVNKVYLN